MRQTISVIVDFFLASKKIPQYKFKIIAEKIANRK